MVGLSPSYGTKGSAYFEGMDNTKMELVDLKTLPPENYKEAMPDLAWPLVLNEGENRLGFYGYGKSAVESNNAPSSIAGPLPLLFGTPTRTSPSQLFP